MSTKSQNGITLVELLTVLAIISILAAVIFPVAAQARRKARETQCMSNLFEVYKASRAFEQDQHKYAEFVAGPAEWVYTIYTDSTHTASRKLVVYNSAQPSDRHDLEELDSETPEGQPKLRSITQSDGMIGDQVVALYPEYLRTLGEVRCSQWELHGGRDKYDTSEVVVDPVFTWLRSIYDTAISNVDQNTVDQVKSRIRFDSRLSYMRNEKLADGTTDNPNYIDPDDPANLGKLSYSLYTYSSYDIQMPPKMSAFEPHYSSVRSFGTANTSGGPLSIYDLDGTTMKANMDRQLRWRNPPVDTVLTWCSFHREVESDGTPIQSSFDQVIFLDGRTKRIDSRALADWTQAWTVEPK